MKGINRILLGCVSIALILSCEKPLKNVRDYFPELKTNSVTVYSDGSVEVSGEMISEGATPLQNWGFCMSTDPTPIMTDNQLFGDASFKAVYDGLDPVGPYYFRAWAYNEDGYSYGNIVSLDIVEAASVNPPCTPTLNTFNYGGNTETVSTVNTPKKNSKGYEIYGSTGSTSFRLTFQHSPYTREYITTTNMTPDVKEVYVEFYSGFTSGTLDAGSKVYVTRLTNSSWEITVCNAPWNGTSFKLTTRFSCPK